MERNAALATLIYGILVGLGGLIGYLKAKSKPSLIAGGVSGVLLIAGAIAGLWEWDRAPVVNLTLAALLLVLFAARFARKKKFMPAGLLAGLSLVVLVLNAIAASR